MFVAPDSRCEICGASRHLEVHHIEPRRMGGSRRREIESPSNKSILCRSCHGNITEQRWCLERTDRNVLKASAGLAVASLSGLASRLAGRLGLPMAASGTGRRVLTEDLRLNAGELTAGSSRRTRVADGRLTLAASGSGEYVSPALRSSFPATHAGLHWRGSAPQSVSFWLRSSPDGQAWSEWQPVVLEAGHGREPLPETFGASPAAACGRPSSSAPATAATTATRSRGCELGPAPSRRRPPSDEPMPPVADCATRPHHTDDIGWVGPVAGALSVVGGCYLKAVTGTPVRTKQAVHRCVIRCRLGDCDLAVAPTTDGLQG